MQALNESAAAVSVARKPRLQVKLNGVVAGGCTHVTVDSNNHYQADTFEAEFITSAGTSTGFASGTLASSAGQPNTQSLAWWGSTDTILVEILIDRGLSGAAEGFCPVFTGEVDGIEADPESGAVRVHGRDLSRRFIDAKTQASYLNQTSSQVARTLAAGHPGISVVGPDTTTLVSRYYGADHDHLTGDSFTRTQTEWDLLTYLAQHEGFDVFMAGTVLHFQPEAQPSDPAFVARMDRGGAALQSQVMNPHLERSLTLAKDIEVWVRSWNASSKAGFTAKSGGKSSGAGKGQAQRVVVVRPNLTQDQAQRLANSIREDMTRHERLFSFDLPGDVTLNARNLVRLEGTGTSWDTTYYVASVSRRLSFDAGFVQTVHAKNHSPANASVPA